jgi:hypothetical protein
LIACVTTRQVCPATERTVIVRFVPVPIETKAEQDMDAGTNDVDSGTVVSEEEKERAEKEAARFDPLNGDL